MPNDRQPPSELAKLISPDICIPKVNSRTSFAEWFQVKYNHSNKLCAQLARRPLCIVALSLKSLFDIWSVRPAGDAAESPTSPNCADREQLWMLMDLCLVDIKCKRLRTMPKNVCRRLVNMCKRYPDHVFRSSWHAIYSSIPIKARRTAHKLKFSFSLGPSVTGSNWYR